MVAEAPQYLTDFISVLKRHSAVRTVSAKPITEGEHQIVEAQIHVPLPSRAKARGESSTGVRDVELVRFEFKNLSLSVLQLSDYAGTFHSIFLTLTPIRQETGSGRVSTQVL